MTFKRRIAAWLQHFAILRWGLSMLIRLFGPQNHVGAMGVIFNNTGHVLLVEHVYRPYHSWGLPGGWVNRGEDPAHTILREVEEELNLKVQVKKLLLCRPQGADNEPTLAPAGLNLAYYCRLNSPNSSLANIDQASSAYEILSARWVDPDKIEWELLPVQQEAIRLGRQEFDREQRLQQNSVDRN